VTKAAIKDKRQKTKENINHGFHGLLIRKDAMKNLFYVIPEGSMPLSKQLMQATAKMLTA
jgi:hypothetical protein